jgi:hypothetical protein
MNSTDERRKKTRYGLRCRVRFFRQSDPISEGVTQNLSSVGFYCLVLVPLKLGESLRCLLKMPSRGMAKDESLLIECRVRVVRVDDADEGGSYGIGVRIEGYSARTPEHAERKSRTSASERQKVAF